jgi:hypothetical protein
MTTMRPHHAMATLLIVGIAAIAIGWAGRAGSAGGTEPAAKESTSTGHQGHEMPATTTATTPAAAKSSPKGVHTTITGEVMDPACYLEAGVKSIGPGHFQCAIDCARSGQTLAIYDRVNDRIYFLAGEMPGKNPNDPVINFIHRKVDVTGVVYHRSGAYGIVINKVVPHKDKG